MAQKTHNALLRNVQLQVGVGMGSKLNVLGAGAGSCFSGLILIL